MAKKSWPWFRKDRNCWFVWHEGKQMRLCEDKAEAFRLWHDMEANATRLPSSPTVGSIIDAYLAEVETRLKPSSLLNKRKVLLRFKAQHGEAPALALTPGLILGFLARQGWGQSYRWLAVAVLKTCLRWGVEQGLLPSNPIVKLKVKSARSRGSEALVSADAYAQLLADAPVEWQNILLALHDTGCRPGELCMIEARHFDAQAGVWLLDEHKTERSGKLRIIYLTPALTTVCKALADRYPTGPIFRNCVGNPLTPIRIRLWLGRARRRLRLGQIMPYAFRHSFATDALVNGVPDAQVSELLGHHGTGMLHRHYAHLGAKADALREALAKVRGQAEAQ